MCWKSLALADLLLGTVVAKIRAGSGIGKRSDIEKQVTLLL